MPTAYQSIEQIRAGAFDNVFKVLYGNSGQELLQRQRYAKLLEDFLRRYGDAAETAEVSLYSVPGRVEICGNHTDHNCGLVVAASVSADLIAAVAKSDRNAIRVKSDGFDYEDCLSLSDLEPQTEEHGKSLAIVRGVAAGIAARGGAVGGLDIYTSSNVVKGGGLSSSAAFEICMGTVMNEEYNGGRFAPLELALIGQAAENDFFGKPSGLMDQIACAFGGVVAIDFQDPLKPEIEKISIEPAKHRYSLVVTNTGGSHANLTHEYRAIREEMERVARCFGKPNLRAVDRAAFRRKFKQVREAAGDRAVLRAIHFFDENDRVAALKTALQQEQFLEFLNIVNASGHSSFEFNQNAYCADDPRHQGIPIALALSQELLGEHGAWRLQGSGFAGTIIAFVPKESEARYCAAMSDVFGPGACLALSIREKGPLKF